MLKITAIGNITTDFALRTKENEELAYAIYLSGVVGANGPQWGRV